MSVSVTVQTGAVGAGSVKQHINITGCIGSQNSSPAADVQATSCLFHKLLPAKLICASHNENNGDK